MDVIKSMQADANIEVKELCVDGGATANNLLNAVSKRYFTYKSYSPDHTETTALGAAYLAGHNHINITCSYQSLCRLLYIEHAYIF